MAKVDELVGSDREPNDASAEDARKAHESGELKGLWRTVRTRTEELREGKCTQRDLDQAMDAFYAWQCKLDRLAVLKASRDEQLRELKQQLLEVLRGDDVYVLDRGAIEQYYPATVTGADKPSKAQDFCSKVTTREAMLGCCDEQKVEREGVVVPEKEFDLIFRGIFT